MTKKDLIKAVAEKANISQKEAGIVVDLVFDGIKDALVAGDKVSIPGFGSFAVTERAAREGKNLHTGEIIQIAASKNVRMKISSDFKAKLNG